MKNLINFLHQTYPELHTKLKKSAFLKNETGNTPEVTISKLMKRLMENLSEWGETNPLQEKFWETFITKPNEIPQNYWDFQKEILIQEGRWELLINGKIPEGTKQQLAKAIISAQKSSLRRWTNYLNSPDAHYPPELKYWIMRSILGLQSYDKKQENFPKRTKWTVAPFPELNQEALALVINHKLQELNGETTQKLTTDMNEQDRELYQKKKNFWDRYALALKTIIKNDGESLQNIKGEWVKYDQGSTPDNLVSSLEGQGTGRCTSAYSTAKSQLEWGDFYVYYSEDKGGKNTKPRVAIRMEGNQIAEIRGIFPDQDLDPNIIPVLLKKLESFGYKSFESLQQVITSKILKLIDKKTQTGEKLSDEELFVLYGLSKNSFTKEDFSIKSRLSSNYNNLRQLWRLQNIKWLRLWNILIPISQENQKELYLDNLEKLPDDFKFPPHIETLYLPNLVEISKGVKFPQTLKELYLDRLEELPDDFELPPHIEKSSFYDLRKIGKRVKLSLNCIDLAPYPFNEDHIYFDKIGDDADLDIKPLSTIQGIRFRSLKELGKRVRFSQTTRKLSFESLRELPDEFELSPHLEELHLPKLIKIGKGVKSRQNLKRLYLDNLRELPDDFEFPPNIEVLHLPKLEKIGKGVKFPQNLKKLTLDNLREVWDDFEFPPILKPFGLILLEKIGKGVKFPQNLKELYLGRLREFPDEFEFASHIEGIELPKLEKISKGVKFPKNLKRLALTNLREIWDDFEFPPNIKTLYLPKLEKIGKGVKFPQNLENLYLDNLEKIEKGVKFPLSLKKLYLDSLEEVPDDFKFPPSIVELFLPRLKKIEKGGKFPQDSDRSFLKNWEEVPDDFEFPPHLEEVHLPKLIKIGKGVKSRQNLKRLYLDNLRELPDDFEFPPNIEKLYLPKLEKIGKGVKFPSDLKKLTLDNLEELPDDFEFPPNIEKLYLPRVEKIGKGVKFPQNLKRLFLYNLREVPAKFKFPPNLNVLSAPDLNKLDKIKDSPIKSVSWYLTHLLKKLFNQ